MSLTNLLCVALTIWISIYTQSTIAHDLQLVINQTSISQLVNLFTPFLDEAIIALKVGPQRIPGTLNVDTSSVTIASFAHDTIQFSLDPDTQQIDVSISNLDMGFDAITFEAWKKVVGYRISCFGVTTPRIYGFDISLRLGIAPNDICTYNLTLDENDVVISDAQKDFSIKLEGDVCKTSFDVADFLFDFEALIYDEIIDMIPSVMQSTIESAAGDIFHEIRSVDVLDSVIAFCYEDVSVAADNVQFAADLILNITNTTKTSVQDSSDNKSDIDLPDSDLTLFHALIVWTIIMLFVGTVFGWCLRNCIHNRDRTSCCNCFDFQKNNKCEHNTGLIDDIVELQKRRDALTQKEHAAVTSFSNVSVNDHDVPPFNGDAVPMIYHKTTDLIHVPPFNGDQIPITHHRTA